MIPLSAGTLARAERLFSGDALAQVVRVLEDEVAERLPLLGHVATPETMERLRYAVLKLSEGELGKFEEAVRVVKEDWRDTLVAAGFGHRVEEHTHWWPEGRG